MAKAERTTSRSASHPARLNASFDAAGNPLSYTGVTATYNDRGRLATVQSGGSTETLTYNALGQLIKSTGGPAGTVLYAYDDARHLLGEYTSTGAMIEEMVWLGDIPIATARPTAQQWIYSINYIHTDQLNAPRQITRAADNVQMWTWFSDPFGTSAANSNPAGAGLFINNLRFPGQIYDPQAGLLQNGMRDYDPLIGRYIESDPIGLAGGSYATYEYCNANPLARTDPSGEAFVNCAKALAELEKAEAKVAGRLAEMADTVACGRRVDSGHIQSLGESVNRLKNAIDNVNKHCGKYTGAAAALAAAAATLAEAVALLFVAVAA